MDEPAAPIASVAPVNEPVRPTLLRDPAVLLGLAVYLLLYGIFFPQAFATTDETSYLSEAWAIQDGQLLDRESPYLYGNERADGVRPFRGRTLLLGLILAPFVAIHWKAAFLVGLGFHLANFLLAAAIFSRCGLSRWWAWLVLLHPTHSLYSRMVMSDVPSATFALGALLLVARDRARPLAIGIVAGLSLFIRITNCWIGLAAGIHFLVADFWPWAKDKKLSDRIRDGDLWKYLVAFVPFCIGLLASNDLLYGGPFTTRYGSNVEVFGLEYLARYLPIRLLALNLFWPLMLAAIFFLPRQLRVFGVSFIVVQILFFSLSAVLPRGYDLITTAIRSSRYLMGPIAALCIGYPLMVGWVLRGREVPRLLGTLAVIGALGATIAMFVRHDAYLSRQARVSEAAYAHTPADSIVYVDILAKELFHPAIGHHELRDADASFRKRGFADVEPGHYFVFREVPEPRTSGQENWIRLADRMEADLRRIAVLTPVEVPEARSLQIYRVTRMIPGQSLPQLSDDEFRALLPTEQSLPVAPD